MAGLKQPRDAGWPILVVRGKLWRMSNPDLDPELKMAFVHDLMAARRAVKDAASSGDQSAEAEAHRAVDRAKQALGERGPVWWMHRAPDLNRHMVKNTPYAAWFAREPQDVRA